MHRMRSRYWQSKALGDTTRAVIPQAARAGSLLSEATSPTTIEVDVDDDCSSTVPSTPIISPAIGFRSSFESLNTFPEISHIRGGHVLASGGKIFFLGGTNGYTLIRTARLGVRRGTDPSGGGYVPPYPSPLPSLSHMYLENNLCSTGWQSPRLPSVACHQSPGGAVPLF
jgi:hypothetical protein